MAKMLQEDRLFFLKLSAKLPMIVLKLANVYRDKTM